MKLQHGTGRRWVLRSVATSLFLFGLLVTILFHPAWLYANKYPDSDFVICAQHQPDARLIAQLRAATELLKTSEWYDRNCSITLCLNDGSLYPGLVQAVQGRAFGYGFYHMVVLKGAMNAAENYVELNGYKWNLCELIAHEATHCLQFNKLGFWRSDPVARYPTWKWEGYPEYVARRAKADLVKNIRYFIATQQTDNNNWISFDDSTGTVMPYYKSWILMQYCKDVRHMKYTEILDDTSSEATVTRSMMAWYAAHNK